MNINAIAITSIIISTCCAVAILYDIWKNNTQQMKIMNIVWPVTALYSGPIGLLIYFKIGRKKPKDKMSDKRVNNAGTVHIQNKQAMVHKSISWPAVVKGTLHCGSGCTLGDFAAEAFLFFIPFTLFGSALYTGWVVDFCFAFIIGIVFQYYAIKPMQKLSTKKALIAALKADTLSLLSWQIGMYGWMAIAVFGIFHHVLKASNPVFWLMMQVAMIIGFFTAYPINWWLIKKGIKEVM